MHACPHDRRERQRVALDVAGANVLRAFNYATLAAEEPLTPRVLAAVNIASVATVIGAASVFAGFAALADIEKLGFSIELFSAMALGVAAAGVPFLAFHSVDVFGIAKAPPADGRYGGTPRRPADRDEAVRNTCSYRSRQC